MRALLGILDLIPGLGDDGNGLFGDLVEFLGEALRSTWSFLFTPEAAAGGAALGAAALTSRWWKAPLMGLFTRILRPHALDQPTRARIHEYITSNPGTRAQRIVDDLGVGVGQALHHLRMLERQGFVTRTGAPFAKYYFPTGALSPLEMQRSVARQHPRFAGLLHAVEQRPGATVTELADALRLSPARVSRMAQQLVQAGVVSRVQEGRTVRLFPPAPSVAKIHQSPH